MTGRCSRLQAPQIWKSRFRMVPMIIGFVLVQVLLFLFFLFYFRTSIESRIGKAIAHAGLG